MAHSLQARKRVRQTERHTERNKPFRTRAAHAVRDARTAIQRGDEGAGVLVRAAQFKLLAATLAQRPGFEVLGLGDAQNIKRQGRHFSYPVMG